MENGMIIEVKVIVEWYFRVRNQALIVKSECYYVNDFTILLIIPNRLFKRSDGITGEFICNGGHVKK